MPNQQHLALFMQGPKAVAEARVRDPNMTFDVSGADLTKFQGRDLDLSRCDFSRATLIDSGFQSANITGADFSNARLDSADLTDADLSDANFAGANLTNADLTGVRVTPTTNLGCTLQGTRFEDKILLVAKIAGADLSSRVLQGIDLSGRDLRDTLFNGATLDDAKFVRATLIAAQFTASKLAGTNFTNANVSGGHLNNANLTRAVLVGANFSGANMTNADLSTANVKRAIFYEAQLSGANFGFVSGTYSARYLRTSVIRPENDARYFDWVKRRLPERVDWELIRTFGRLPLFGASYSVLILIPTYIYALEVYNNWVNATRAWIEHSGLPSHVHELILRHLHEEPIPSRWKLLLFSTISLAAASTIYAVWCPARIKAFTRDQWCDEHGHSLVHYWADAWKTRWLRLLCFSMYLGGAIGAVYVLATKLWCAGAIMFGLPSACF